MECQIYYDYILNMCLCLEPNYYDLALKLTISFQGIV